MSELVRAYKQHYNPGGSEGLDDYMRKVVAKCVIYFMGIKEDVRRHEGSHNRRDRSEDVNALLDFLLNDGLESKGATFAWPVDITTVLQFQISKSLRL